MHKWATGNYPAAMGYNTTAGHYSSAMGSWTTASGNVGNKLSRISALAYQCTKSTTNLNR